jgi:hemoglobin
MDPLSLIASSIGENALRRMVSLFYQKVRADDLIGPLYPPDDWSGAEKRLADFLIYRFGGAQTYIEQRGHPRLRARHIPFPIHSKERDRWLALMQTSMEETPIPSEHSQLITAFFQQVADAMRNRPDDSAPAV